MARRGDHRSWLQIIADFFRDELLDTPNPTVTSFDDYIDEYAYNQIPEPIVYENLDTVATIRPGNVHLHGMFSQIRSHLTRNGLRVTNAVLSDDSGNVRVAWYKANVAPLLMTGVVYEVSGKFLLSAGKLQISHPDFRRLEEGCFPFKEEIEIQGSTSYEPAVQHRNVWTAEISGTGLSKDSDWNLLRQKVFKRDNFKCVQCGSDYNLTVDHIKEVSIGGTNELNNLRTLCKDCHEERHLRRFLERGFDANDNYGQDTQLTKKIAALDKALNENSGLSISYKDKFDVRSYRVIHPKKIYKGFRGFNKDKVYVDAYCDLDNAGRTFRVSRMKLSNSNRSEYLDKPVYKLNQ